MTFVPAVDTVKVTMQYADNSGNILLNIYHLTKPGGYTDAEFAGVAGAWIDVDGLYFAPVRSEQVALTQVTVLGLEVPDGRVFVDTLAVPQAGTITEQSMPGNVTVAVSWRTGFSGRSYRGRTYHVGLCGSQVINNALTLTAHAAILAAYTDALAEFVGVFGIMVVCSFVHDGSHRTTAALTPITYCSLNNDLDSQRRRLNGRGR